MGDDTAREDELEAEEAEERPTEGAYSLIHASVAAPVDAAGALDVLSDDASVEDEHGG